MIPAVYSLSEIMIHRFDQAQQHLKEIIQRFRDTICLPPVAKLIPSTSPIQGIILSGSAAVKIFERYLNRQGFLVRAVCFPTVPKNAERIRICIHAHNTTEDIDSFVGCVHEFFRKDFLKSKM